MGAGEPVGRSHRLHRPRGGFCGRGYCQQCRLPSGALGCETPGGNREQQRIDLLRPLGRAGEWMEPWFYETRFLRPSFARQAILELLRRLSAASALPRRGASSGGPIREVRTDVLVVGGGPAGVAAAAAAARRVPTTLVTRTSLGGSLPLDPSTSRSAQQDAIACRDTLIDVFEDSLVLGVYPAEGIVAAATTHGPLIIRAERCVIATGAYDRPLLLPGSDLPGVLGLRAFQRLAAGGKLRRQRVGALGGVTELERVEASAEASGLDLAWSVGPDGSSGEVDGIARVARIVGRRRARGIAFEDGSRLHADVVVIATTQPTYELQLHLGAVPRFEGSPPVIVTDGGGDMPYLVVGEAQGWTDPPTVGIRAAAATDAWLDGDPHEDERIAPSACVGVTPAPDAVVCVCEDVRRRDLDRAIDEGFDDVDLVKRRSGASTGACQGKLCLALIAEAFVDRGLEPSLPTVRPPIRPVHVATLAGGR